jgi:hypothetical protein
VLSSTPPRRELADPREEIRDAQQVLVREEEIAPEARALARVDEAALEELREGAAVQLVHPAAARLELPQPTRIPRLREIDHR